MSRLDYDTTAGKAALLLEQASRTVTALAPAEDPGDRAMRLRGAASFAETAATELRELCGYLEAVAAGEGGAS